MSNAAPGLAAARSKRSWRARSLLAAWRPVWSVAAALRDPELVCRAAADYPGQILVDIGVRGGKVAVQGWGEVTEAAPSEVARRFAGSGVAALA